MKETFGEKVFYACNYALLTLIGISCLLPLIHVASLSFSGNDAIMSGRVGLWPAEFTMRPYENLLSGTRIMEAFRNSVVLTVVGTALNMVLTILAAYPLSRKSFFARRQFTLMIVFTMLFSAGLIPNYLLVNALGLIDSYWAIWLPGLVSAYNLLVLRTFFEGIPEELFESAKIDGCGDWRLVARIVLPLSLPVLATLSLFYGVGHWNSFFNVLIYINDPLKHNLSVLVQNMIRSQSLLQEITFQDPEALKYVAEESIKSAGIVVMVLPMLVVYPFLQRFFVKGVLIGSIKG